MRLAPICAWETLLAIALGCVTVAVTGCGRLGFDESTEGGAADASGVTQDGGSSLDAGFGTDATLPLIGLVASWDLDDGAGQVVSANVGTDGVIGTSNALEAVDPAWDAIPARICAGAGLRFDGVDDIVTIPGPSTASLSSFTIAFSMYATGSGEAGLPRILSKEDGGLADTIVHFRAVDDAIAINMFNTGGTLFATFAGAVVGDQRANWAITFDDAGDRRVHVYQNGQEATYLRQDIMTGAMRTTTQSWQIGNQITNTRTFDGTLDAIHVYDRALAPGEIATLSAICPP